MTTSTYDWYLENGGPKMMWEEIDRLRAVVNRQGHEIERLRDELAIQGTMAGEVRRLNQEFERALGELKVAFCQMLLGLIRRSPTGEPQMSDLRLSACVCGSPVLALVALLVLAAALNRLTLRKGRGGK